MKKNYLEKKDAAREAAIEWQTETAQKNYSYGELAFFQNHFYKLGKRYGLLKEFKENCII